MPIPGNSVEWERVASKISSRVGQGVLEPWLARSHLPCAGVRRARQSKGVANLTCGGEVGTSVPRLNESDEVPSKDVQSSWYPKSCRNGRTSASERPDQKVEEVFLCQWSVFSFPWLGAT